MRTPALCFLVAAAALSFGQVSKSGTGYLFRAKYTKGQKMTYTMNVSSTGLGSQGMKMTSPIVMTVKGVAKGIATVEVKTGPAVMNGKSQGKSETQTVQLDSRNKPVGGKSSFEGIASFTFPEKPVAVGATWTGTAQMTTQMGNVDLQAKYKFIGLKKVAGKQIAEVKTSFTGSLMGKITGEATTWVLVTDGSLMKSDGKMFLEIQLDPKAKPMTIPTTMTITRK